MKRPTPATDHDTTGAERRAEELAEAAACDREWRIIDESSRHLPGLRPAVRTLGRHIVEQRPKDVGHCCADGDWE